MALSLPDLSVELIHRVFNFIPNEENEIISVRETCRALALKTTEIFAWKYFLRGSWRLTPRAVSALTGISKNKILNPTLKHVTLFRYTNEYEYGSGASGYSLAKRIDIKKLGQSLQTLANLRSLHLAKFDFIGFENFLGGLSLPLITDFRLSEIVVHASNLQNFIALHSNTIDTVVFNKLHLTAPAKGAWSGLLGSLTQLKDVKLINIRKPLKCGYFVRFEPKDEEDSTFESKDEEYSTFERYVQLDLECDYCECCYNHPSQIHHYAFGVYRLGTDAKKEDWTRGLELMVARSRTVDFSYNYDIGEDGYPDP